MFNKFFLEKDFESIAKLLGNALGHFVDPTSILSVHPVSLSHVAGDFSFSDITQTDSNLFYYGSFDLYRTNADMNSDHQFVAELGTIQILNFLTRLANPSSHHVISPFFFNQFALTTDLAVSVNFTGWQIYTKIAYAKSIIPSVLSVPMAPPPSM